MNPILRFYPGDEATLFAVNVLAQVTVAGFLAWLARRYLRKTSAPTRHGVYFAALTWMLLSPLTAYVCQSAGVVLVTIPVAEAQVPAEPKRILDAPAAEQSPGPDAVPDVAKSSVAEPTEKSPTAVSSLPPTVAQQLPVPQPSPELSREELLRVAVTVAFWLWGLGMLYFLGRLIHGLRTLAALRREVQPIHDARLEVVRAQVCQALGVADLPVLVASPRVGGPLAVGVCRPMVVLPADLVRLLDARQLREVLIHECAHVLRGDAVVGLLQRLAEMVFWPHPLVHLLNRELAQAREEVCDNHVLLASNGPDYARTLLALAEGATHSHFAPATSGLLGRGWRLEDRVAGLLNQGRKRMIRMTRTQAAGVAVVFMMAALAIAGTRLIAATAPQPPTSDIKEPPPAAKVPILPAKKGEKPMPPAAPPMNGLSITVRPTKAVFVLKEQLSFTVSFKNVSQKTLLLYDIDQTMAYKIEINGVPTGGPWVPGYNLNHQAEREAPKASDSRALAPGVTFARQVVMNGVSYAYRGPQPAKHPISQQHLDAGTYRITVGFKGLMNPAKVEWKEEHSIGAIAAQSPEFVIGGKIHTGAALVVKGLSVAATTEHLLFPGNVIPYFKVRFANVSDKDFSLFGYQFPSWTLHIKNKATGLVQTWKHVPRAAAPVMPPLVLAAGKSHDEEIVLRPESFCIPAKKVGAVALEPGKYEIVFEIELRESPYARAIIPAFWVGQVRTAPLAFRVGDGAAKER